MGNKLPVEVIVCVNCSKPGSWYEFKENKIHLNTGTFRVWGTYKNTKGKIVNKEYAHFPSCEAIKTKEVVWKV